MINVVVTGANKGIGFEVAKQMAELGYFVYLGCRNEQNGSEAISNLKKLNISNVELLQIDVSDLNSVKEAVSKLASKIDALDILINNAGISGSQPQNIFWRHPDDSGDASAFRKGKAACHCECFQRAGIFSYADQRRA
jgi:NAD(P)-dependent dehydrogenase (short-subunit alcohol dehydrogenase family)